MASTASTKSFTLDTGYSLQELSFVAYEGTWQRSHSRSKVYLRNEIEGRFNFI